MATDLLASDLMPPAPRERTSRRRVWVRVLLTFSSAAVVVALVWLAPSASAAGGCGGG